MTTLVPYDDVNIEQTFDAMTAWLDKIFASNVRSHRELLELEHSLELLEQEVCDIDRYLPAELPPTQAVAAMRLGLRFSDTDNVMYRLWTSAAVRRSSLLAMRGIHERYLGPVPSSREQLVVYEIDRMFRNADLSGYVQAHRLEQSSRWTGKWSTTRSVSLVVVEGPLWVHDIYRNLLGESLRGSALRARYMRDTESGSAGNDWMKERPEEHLLGQPSRRPEPELLDTALRLWEPEEERSPFRDFSAAVEAALLI
jgi:hypothetical protein